MHFMQGHTLTLSAFPCGRTLINHMHAFWHATAAGYLLELLLTWFKKYHPLFPNYTSAFISSFNCLYQKDHNVIPATETLPSKCDKTCQTLQKHPAPNESINFISL